MCCPFAARVLASWPPTRSPSIHSWAHVRSQGRANYGYSMEPIYFHWGTHSGGQPLFAFNGMTVIDQAIRVQSQSIGSMCTEALHIAPSSEFSVWRTESKI